MKKENSVEKAPEQDPALDFEEALRRLEAVVENLERGDAGLAQALTTYEEGVRLLAACQGSLERAERSVALLTGVDASGAPVTSPFDASATVTPPSPSSDPPAPTTSRTRPRKPAVDDEGPPF
jgi:exodeoxyribonuclease VII small subunit